jgi:hypothetical protein
MRERFEEWARSEGYSLKVLMDDPLEYVSTETDDAWTGWQAAAAAERKRLMERFTQERAILMRDGFPVGVHYIDRAIQQIKEAQP